MIPNYFHIRTTTQMFVDYHHEQHQNLLRQAWQETCLACRAPSKGTGKRKVGTPPQNPTGKRVKKSATTTSTKTLPKKTAETNTRYGKKERKIAKATATTLRRNGNSRSTSKPKAALLPSPTTELVALAAAHAADAIVTFQQLKQFPLSNDVHTHWETPLTTMTTITTPIMTTTVTQMTGRETRHGTEAVMSLKKTLERMMMPSKKTSTSGTS